MDQGLLYLHLLFRGLVSEQAEVFLSVAVGLVLCSSSFGIRRKVHGAVSLATTVAYALRSYVRGRWLRTCGAAHRQS